MIKESLKTNMNLYSFSLNNSNVKIMISTLNLFYTT